MLPASFTKYTFISLVVLLHAFVPALSIPVQPRPSLATSLDITLPKRPDIAWTDTPLSKRPSQPRSNPVDHIPYPSRLFARTSLDPHQVGHLRSLSPPHVEMLADHRAPPSLGRRWWLFDKVKEGFKKAGEKIKQGVQKVKGAIQTAGNKIAGGIQAARKKITQGFQTVGNKIKQGFQTAGNKIKQGFQKVKQGFQTAGSKIKQGFQTAGRKMKEGFRKAGKWIKDNGAKVAKFGLKVVSTAASVAGHFVSLVPGVGKGIGKSLSAVSKLSNFASNKIHADLGDQLNKGMDVMNKIENPLSGTAGKIFEAVLKRDTSE